MEIIPSLFDTAQCFVAKLLWGREVVSNRRWLEKSLAQHREASEDKLSKINLPQSIASCLKQTLSDFELSLNHAYEWFRIYEEEILLSKVDILNGKYSFRNFMTLGKFDDKKWVEQFIHDQEVDLLIRFYFACCYCVEEKIRLFWQEISGNRSFMNEVNYRWIYRRASNLAIDWIRTIDADYENVGYYHWMDAPSHEHALRFCMNTRRRTFSFREMCLYAVYEPKMIHMFFSEFMSRQMQLLYLQDDFRFKRNTSIWKYYINPLIVEYLPNLFELHQDSLRETAFTEVLSNLALKISQISSPIYRNIFCQIWEIGSERNKSYFIENGLDVMLCLFWSKAFTSTKCVLKDFSIDQKRRILKQTAEKVLSSSKIASFCEDDIRKYLLLFLLDDNAANVENTVYDKMKFHPKSSSLLVELRERVTMVYDLRCRSKNRKKKNIAEKSRRMYLSVIKSLMCDIKTFENFGAN